MPKVDEDLSDFDPTQEGGGGPCTRCGAPQEPWRYADVCQACLWPEPFELEDLDAGTSWGLIIVLLLALALPALYIALALFA